MRSLARLRGGERALAAVGEGERRLLLGLELGSEVYALNLRKRSHWFGLRVRRFFPFRLYSSLACMDGRSVVDLQQVHCSSFTGPVRLYLLQLDVLLIAFPFAPQSLRPVSDLSLVLLLEQLLLVQFFPFPPRHLSLQRLQRFLVDPAEPLVEFLPVQFLGLPTVALRILVVLQNPMKIPPSDQSQSVIPVLPVPGDKAHLNFIIPQR